MRGDRTNGIHKEESPPPHLQESPGEDEGTKTVRAEAVEVFGHLFFAGRNVLCALDETTVLAIGGGGRWKEKG